jgi:DNA-binding CsgD family transcriptional regulator
VTGVLADRQIELTLLDDLLQAAGRRNGSLVVVSGPIGVGKTALLGAVAAKAGGDTAVLAATGSTLERLFPFGVVRQLCEPVIAELDDDERRRVDEGLTEFARPLFATEDCLRVTVDPHAPVMQQVMQGVRHLLTVFGENRPVLLLVDDVQWADTESVRCLGYLANRLAGTGVLMVVTVREGSPDGDNQGIRHLVGCASRVLRLGPLSMTGVRAIVRQRFGVPGSDRFVQACGEVSRGNPMVLGAVLDELVAEDGAPDDDGAERARACRPSLLRERMAARLRAQPEAAMAFLRALSCLGIGTDPDLVARLAGLDGIGYTEVLRSLAAQGFLLTEQTPEFAHPVVREAVDRLTSPAQAERLHVTAATVLHAAGRPAELVADHLLAVPSQQVVWAVDVLRDAAVQAAQRGDTDAATRYLRRALLDIPPESVHRADLLLELANVERAVDVSASVRHVLEAATLSHGVSGQAAALARLSPASLGMAPPELLTMVGAVTQALGASGVENELALRMAARAAAGDIGGADRIEAAVRRLRDADRFVESPGGRELLAVLLELAAVSGAVPSGEVARLSRLVLAREPATTGGHMAAPMVLTALSLADCAVAPALPWLDAALDSALRQGDRVAQTAVEAGRALVLLGAGRISEGASRAADGLAAGECWFDAVTVAGMLRIVTALQLYGTDRTPRTAVDGVEQAVTDRIIELCGQRTDHPAVPAMARVASAGRAYGEDELWHSLEQLLDCGRHLDRAGWRNPALVPWRTSAAWLYHRVGDTTAALELAAAEYELATAWGAPAAVGRVLRVQGALTEGPAGLRLLRSAVDVLQDSEDSLERARAHLLLGGRLQREGADDAEVHLRHGQELTEKGTARRLVDRELRAMAGVPSEPGRRLTAAERRVVAMVVDGLTNQAIADELGVSRRAVEKHLTNVYGKYDVAGRAELKARLP